MMTFCSLGVDYRTADTVALARMRGVLARADFPQRFLLATCNRSELFYFGDPSARPSLFADEPSLLFKSGTAALFRLFRIAAGLDSMIFGEYQILGQVKAAAAAARAGGTVGRELGRVLLEAVTAAKRVRTELDLGAVPPSVCQAALAYLDAHFGLRGRRVFIIGSGRTGTLAARLAQARGAASLMVCNRSIERTARLVAELGAVAVPYERRATVLAASDLVISATASPHVVLPRGAAVLTQPVIFLDLATPRDIDPAWAEDPLATLISLDTLGELAAGDRAEREWLTARAMLILTSAVDATAAWLEAQA